MSERWLRCGAEVVTPDGIQTVSSMDVDGPLVWTEDEYGNTSMWSASALRPLEPVSYREHARVVAERDRLRRELEALRDEMRASHQVAEQHAIDAAIGPMSAAYSRHAGRSDALRDVVTRLDAILTGEVCDGK